MLSDSEIKICVIYCSYNQKNRILFYRFLLFSFILYSLYTGKYLYVVKYAFCRLMYVKKALQDGFVTLTF